MKNVSSGDFSSFYSYDESLPLNVTEDAIKDEDAYMFYKVQSVQRDLSAFSCFTSANKISGKIETVGGRICHEMVNLLND